MLSRYLHKIGGHTGLGLSHGFAEVIFLVSCVHQSLHLFTCNFYLAKWWTPGLVLNIKVLTSIRFSQFQYCCLWPRHRHRPRQLNMQILRSSQLIYKLVSCYSCYSPLQAVGKITKIRPVLTMTRSQAQKVTVSEVSKGAG